VGKLILDDVGFTNYYDSLRNIDISSTGLTDMKSSWFSRRNIEALDISKNSLSALKKDHMKFFPFLKYFNASFNEIKTLEMGTFLECKKLEVLSLSHNLLASAQFDNIPNLRALYAKSNNINNMAGTYSNMPKLEILNLADNNIASIGDRGLQTLESLKFLNVSHNKLPYIPGYWFWGNDKTKLSEVDLSYNSITYIDHVAFK
jgi:Leucine-rich repeat (LRR) protein